MDPRATIVPSGDPWYFAAWIEGPGPFDIYLQRFSRDGIVDPAWPAGGLKVGTATLSLASWLFRCFPDGSGGVTLSWVEDAGNQANVYACRVLADGSYANGYPGGARLLAVLDLYRIRPATLGVAVCPGRNGGLFVGWVARLNAQTFEHALRGRWYGAGGAPDPSPALYESDLGPDVPGQDEITALAAHPDSGGGAYVLLSCNGEAYPSSFAVVAHVTQHSLADVPKPPGARTLALAVSPNPARGAFSANFTLPDDRPARLELLDVNGRRVWSRDVRGAGARTLAVEPRETLAPGVYLLRLTHAGAGRTARVAILH
jgi:hypothetical protein